MQSLHKKDDRWTYVTVSDLLINRGHGVTILDTEPEADHLSIYQDDAANALGLSASKVNSIFLTSLSHLVRRHEVDMRNKPAKMNALEEEAWKIGVQTVLEM